jgi:hypothetical protein
MADGLMESLRGLQIRKVIISVQGVVNAILGDFLLQICHGDDLLFQIKFV